MFEQLKNLGITHPEEIDRYSLRQEANQDILKIYFRKDKGEFFAKSVKFKYPRQRKTVTSNQIAQDIYEMNPGLRQVIDELNNLCHCDDLDIDLRNKILEDLRHLEAVVSNKITEIESDIERLVRK